MCICKVWSANLVRIVNRVARSLTAFLCFSFTRYRPLFVVVMRFLSAFFSVQAGFLSGKSAFLSSELESARSGVVFEVIAREQTVAKAASQSMMAHFRNTPTTYNRFVFFFFSKGRWELPRTF